MNDEQINSYIKENFIQMTDGQLAKETGLKIHIIKYKVNKVLKLSRRNLWNDETHQFLIDNYDSMTPKEIAEAIGTSASAVHSKASKLGLTKKLRVKNNAQSLEGEEWKILSFNDKYSISSYGRIKYNKFNSLLNPRGKKGSYLQVEIEYKQYRVHRLVAETFNPNPENKPEVNHDDGDKHNNYATNLIWATNLENIGHAHETGLMRSNHYRSKLSDEEIHEICRMLKEDVKRVTIRKKFNLSPNYTLYRLKRCMVYKDITTQYFKEDE